MGRHPDGTEQLLQVCANLDSADTRDRECRALLAAAAEHPRATLHVITLATEGVPPVPQPIQLHDAAQWLL
jgi:hypothetical protein